MSINISKLTLSCKLSSLSFTLDNNNCWGYVCVSLTFCRISEKLTDVRAGQCARMMQNTNIIQPTSILSAKERGEEGERRGRTCARQHFGGRSRSGCVLNSHIMLSKQQSKPYHKGRVIAILYLKRFVNDASVRLPPLHPFQAVSCRQGSYCHMFQKPSSHIFQVRAEKIS